MLILAIRTDNPDAEVGLYVGETQVAYKKWHAHRELSVALHKTIKELLQGISKDWHDIEGIVAFKGPGSFTGLRIGLTVAGALAYGLKAPIVGSMDEDWIQTGIKWLLAGENDSIILPEYGAEAHITLPKR